MLQRPSAFAGAPGAAPAGELVAWAEVLLDEVGVSQGDMLLDICLHGYVVDGCKICKIVWAFVSAKYAMIQMRAAIKNMSMMAKDVSVVELLRHQTISLV